TGPAVVPGHPEKSLLIEAVKYSNDDMKMPPKNRLPASAVADLTQWVQMGAPWPQEAAPAVAKAPAGPAANYEKLRREHWAWQPVKTPAIPAVKNAAWPRSDVDRFLLAKLEEKGLQPVVDADRVALIRRVTFDLIGLPPTPQEVDAFVNDRSAAAFEAVVDRLLASPRFGEKWGRHWLDVARYGESTGSARNVPYSQAWRYRDYVIDSFNSDKPYDRFITEQIAGDLLPYDGPAQHNEQLIATGFLAIGVKDLNERDRRKYEMDNVDEQIDVTTRAILGLTVSCARCHDHKFDPIPTSDYYSLAGIFTSTEILSGVQARRGGALVGYGAPNMLVPLDGPAGAPVASAAPKPEDPRKVQMLMTRLNAVRGQIQSLRAAGQNVPPAKRRELRQEINRLQNELKIAQGNAASNAAAGLSAMGVRDGTPADTRICIHGEPEDLGPIVPRGFVGLIHLSDAPAIASSHSGRLELAQWITDEQNPLTARVMANRIWQHLFGEGLVRTVDNFGSTGEAPSHPELLDYLATTFADEDWSVKSLIRALVLSHAYQLSTTASASAATIDPGDRLIWRMNPRRLEAEEIRDAMLFSAGRLDVTRPTASPAATLPVAELRAPRIERLFGANADTHRSVYQPILRSLLPESLDLFDFAEPTMVTGARDTTTVATQALFLMNNAFVIEQSHGLAARVLESKTPSDAAKVDLTYRLTLSRNATAAERQRALAYIADYARSASPKDPARAHAEAWASFCQALLGAAEFRYLN
ncbi:MAG: Planctomycete cytochrome, partial [Phycisphaerales bacterium]|nr:Planctomycete cytochrome [Phycisphaerales bacterium]